jgi:hypothetical protein
MSGDPWTWTETFSRTDRRPAAALGLAEPDAAETGEQCIHCLRYTYEPGCGCTRCGRGLPSDEAERYDDE